MHKIAIFASGNGSNAENIIQYFKEKTHIVVSLILSNKKEAYVLKRASNSGIPSVFLPKNDFLNGNSVEQLLKEHKIDFIVLAGFLLKIPESLIKAFPNKIINIHPALLPAYGGKGMYGMNVHNAVIENKEKSSGISIHYVNEQYDEGAIIFQAQCKIEENDSPDDLAEKIHALEYEHFPKVIEQVLSS